MLMASLVPQPQRRENVALARRPIANMTAAEVDRRLANKLFSKFRNVQAAVSRGVPPVAPLTQRLIHSLFVMSLSRVCVFLCVCVGIWRQFRMFDNDHSGSVSHSEFRDTLASLGFNMDDAEFSKFVRTYDTKNIGHVDYMMFNNKVTMQAAADMCWAMTIMQDLTPLGAHPTLRLATLSTLV